MKKSYLYFSGQMITAGKNTLFVFLLVLAFSANAQHSKKKSKKEKKVVECGKFFQAAINYSIDLPNAKKMPFMNTAKGYEWSFRLKPVKKIPVWLTWDFGTGTYGKQKFAQSWNPPGIDTVITGNAIYRSRLHKVMFGLRITRRDENARWQPYVNLGGGYVQFLSTVKISGDVVHSNFVPAHYIPNSDYDADDWVPDHTETKKEHYKEEKQTYCCGAYVWTAGAGIQMRIADELENRNGVNTYLDLSINYIGGINQQATGLNFFKGADVCYVNDNYMKDQQPYPAGGDPARDPNKGYVNVSPESVPQKKLAKLSYSPISMFNINLGYVIRF